MTAPQRFHDELSVGEELPELVLPVTRTLIVAGAIASRDYQDVHHDAELAKARGSEDIFMNILTTNGLVGRFVTDWAGPAAVLEKVAIRLGAPNYPGDTMTLTGRIEALEEAGGRDDGRGAVTVSVRGRNSRGDHVTGTVRLALPVRGAKLRPLPEGGAGGGAAGEGRGAEAAGAAR
jgi:acyl dehydratase